MTNEEHDAVVNAVTKSKCHVLMHSGAYVHEFCQLWEQDGEWWIKNNVLVEQKLRDVRFHDLTFFKRVEVWPAKEKS